jgi:hypothetical protein
MTRIEGKLPEQVGDERTFQIRNVGSDGCGSFEHFTVTSDTPEQEIFDLACTIMTEAMELKERQHMPSFFREPPKWRNTIKVVEMKRKVIKLDKVNERTGRDWTNEWSTKRGGLKFKIHNSWCEVTFSDGEKGRCNGYKTY